MHKRTLFHGTFLQLPYLQPCHIFLLSYSLAGCYFLHINYSDSYEKERLQSLLDNLGSKSSFGWLILFACFNDLFWMVFFQVLDTRKIALFFVCSITDRIRLFFSHGWWRMHLSVDTYSDEAHFMFYSSCDNTFFNQFMQYLSNL